VKTWNPGSIDLERHILGAFLMPSGDPSAAVETLSPQDFQIDRHGLLFAAFAEMWQAGQPVDLLTASAFLTRKGNLEAAGGDEYLMSITSEVVSDANLAAHARLVKEDALRRRMIVGASQVLEWARDPQKSNEEVLGEGESILRGLAESRYAQGLQSFGSLLPATMGYLEKVFKGEITGVPTGLVDLDRVTGGLQPTDLIIVAARPGMGKTSLGVSVAWRSAMKGKRVALFSLEMGFMQIQQRVLCALKNINLFKLRTAKLNRLELELLRESVEALKNIPLFIDDASRKNPLQILSQARRMAHDKGIDLLVLDHIQLGKMDKKIENKAEELAEFSYALKGIGKDMNIPVLAMAQLSRKAEQHNGDPALSDLKASGGIEEAADIVGFINRPEVYDKEAEKGFSELLFGKYRNGPSGEAIKLRFNHDSASFSDYVEPRFMEGMEQDYRHAQTYRDRQVKED
jgi:replicative DNA helicase